MRTGIALLFVLSSFLAPALAPLPASAETILIEADRDATLIEEPDGALGNGAGPVFFAGRTNQARNSVRRGLLHFDIAEALPRNARVESVRLTLFKTPGPNSASRRIALHRLLADWGEGTSSASGGGGDSAAPGDATWIHTFYDDEFWVASGGHFVRRSSASQEVSDSGFYTWENAGTMLVDVRRWLVAPQRNFGWILLGDETTPQNAKTFASREEPDVTLRPVLEVTYHLPRKGEARPRLHRLSTDRSIGDSAPQ